MIKKVLAGFFGALLFGILAPVLYVLLIGLPGTLMGFIWLAVAGAGVGAVLGALFPAFFGAVFEMFLDL